MQSRVTEGYRLSPQQRRVWLLQGNSSTLRAQCALRIEGRLRTDALKRALNSVINRHPILRTRLCRPPGIKYPVQIVSAEMGFLWQEVELNGPQSVGYDSLFEQEARREFDYERGPLLSAILCARSELDHMLLISMPALVADMASLHNLAGALVREYDAALQSRQSPGEAMPYVQFGEWQNKVLEQEGAEEGKAYWRKLGITSLDDLSFPFERAQSGGTSFAPESLALAVDPATTGRVEATAGRYDASTEEFLLAVWQTLIWRITAWPRIAIGLAVDGREYDMFRDAIGLFARLAPVVSDLEEGVQFNDLLRKTAASARDAYEWQDYFSAEDAITYAVGRAVEKEGVARFGLGFEFEERPPSWQAGGALFSIDRQRCRMEPFKMKLSCVRDGPSLVAEFHYDSALFRAEDVARLAGQFQTLLEDVLNHPESVIGRLEMLSDIERRFLVDINATTADRPLDACIHQLFEAQAERKPGHVAVVCEDQQMTYAELNSRANQLAHHLRSLGVGPESLVAICVERSLETIVGILGVLKAGGAYAPLDSGQPKGRLAAMLGAARPVVLLTQRRLADKFPESGFKVVCLDADWPNIARGSDANPESAVTPRNLVYVIFTSGSTGAPKGVAVEHRALLNYLHSVRDIIALPDDATYATVSTIAADLGNTVIFTSLCGGGSLHVISQERAADAASLAEYFHRHEVACLKIVPSHLAALLVFSRPEQVLPSQRLVLGGAASNWDLIEKIRNLAPDCDIINHYGPTETTVGVLTYRVERNGAQTESATVPLGRPISNTQVYLLRDRHQLAPIWLTGELHIAGTCLARGYLNHPDLTAEKFLPNPFSNEPGARMYRSGDLARRLPTGDVEFLGRADQQVKLRGFRIELGEIEAALRSHSAVREAVVAARNDASGETRLVAYLVARPGGLPSIDQVRRFLLERLPDYMTPAVFVTLDKLPLTSNGKVDRHALPGPAPAQVEAGERSSPHAPFEEIMAGIWSELLGVEQIRRDQNFFELGGHSLLATQLISRVREAFKVEAPLRVLFEAPTLGKLAERIAALMTAGKGLQVPPIKRAARGAEIPLSFAQQRMWFVDKLDPGNPSYNIPKAMRLGGALNTAALEASLGEIIRRHEALRTVFPAIEARPVQVIAPAQGVNLPLVDLSGLSPERRADVAQQLSAMVGLRPFDLVGGPLFRFSLVKREEQEHWAIVTMHHIVSDAWSTGVFVTELAALYQAFSRGKPSPLTEPPIQYADFVHWQREWLQGETLAEHLDYWRRQLAGAPPTLDLPADRSRPLAQTFHGASQDLALGPELSGALEALSRREGATLFMTLLAAFQILLRHCAKQDDIVVGTDIANRNHAETEGLVGFFANQLVLRANLAGDPTFRELLAQARETALGAYAYQDLPFDKLVEALRPERNLKYSPLFQVKFVYQNAPLPAPKLPGLELSAVMFPSQVTKFDWTLFLHPSDQGVVGWMEYNTDLFDGSTVARVLRQFKILLANIVRQPVAPVSALLQGIEEEERKRRDLERRELDASNFSRLKNVKPKVIILPQGELVKTGYLRPGQTLPLVIEPAVEALDLAGWVRSHRDAIDADLLKHGAILFRGCAFDSASDFERFAKSLCSELFSENGELPRASLGGKVYSPVEYPADKPILWHNENTFCPKWPGKIMFCCLHPAESGGETPLADSRKVLKLITPGIVEKFARKKIMYLRNYSGELGLTWQAVFQTTRKTEVEEHCRRHSIAFEWKDGDLLRTRAVRPAVIKHPRTGEMVWFNQATHWHLACHDPETKRSLQSVFREEDLPRHCYYGDGSSIEDSVMDEICDAFRRAEVCFPWRRGDVALLDNMLTAHARNPYTGRRVIAVAMGDMVTHADVENM